MQQSESPFPGGLADLEDGSTLFCFGSDEPAPDFQTAPDKIDKENAPVGEDLRPGTAQGEASEEFYDGTALLAVHKHLEMAEHTAQSAAHDNGGDEPRTNQQEGGKTDAATGENIPEEQPLLDGSLVSLDASETDSAGNTAGNET